MDCLYELTLKHRELIEKKLAELCAEETYVKCSCGSVDNYQGTLNLLSNLYFELLSDLRTFGETAENPYLNHKIGPEKVKDVQRLMTEGTDYKGFVCVLNRIKHVVRDVIFLKARDNNELYNCISQNDLVFDKLQIGIYNHWVTFQTDNEILKKVFELTPFGVFIHGEDQFIHVNTIGEKLIGYTNKELNSMSIKDLVHPDHYEIFSDDIKSWSIHNDILIKRFECKLINKSGAVIWVDISVGQVKIDGRIRWLATAIDISELKRIERNLSKSERKYKTFFNFSPDMIYLIDKKKGMIEEANPMMLNTLGVTLEEIRSMSINDFYAGDNLDGLKDAFECLMNGNDIKGLEIKVKNVYGEQFDFEVNCTPITEGEQVTKILCLARNVTERKKMDELKKQAYESIKLLNETLEYDKIKTEFFSNLSHELRTPLNVILGTLQVMDMVNYKETDPGHDKMKKYSRIMRQNCYRLLRLVNNLIDLNKLDAGYMSLNVDNHDIVSITSKIVSSVSDYIESKGIEFSFETKTPSKVIACDPDKMERILLNLLSNAAKFTESGGKISVKLWDEKDSLFMSVKDTGVGIPKEKQDLVFKRFVQIDKSLSRVHQGSGIGLSLVKSLVELHGGNIILASEEGEGCEFIIELPIREALVSEKTDQQSSYTANNKIEIINIEFADIYS